MQTGRKVVEFTGRNGQGVISISGLNIGDQIIAVMDMTNGGVDHTTLFGRFVTTNNELLQVVASDQSANSHAALIERTFML